MFGIKWVSRSAKPADLLRQFLTERHVDVLKLLAAMHKQVPAGVVEPLEMVQTREGRQSLTDRNAVVFAHQFSNLIAQGENASHRLGQDASRLNRGDTGTF